MIQAYKENAAFILSRRNTVTGVAYGNDPTIFSWNLINEGRCETANCTAADIQVRCQGHAFGLKSSCKLTLRQCTPSRLHAQCSLKLRVCQPVLRDARTLFTPPPTPAAGPAAETLVCCCRTGSAAWHPM